MPDKHSFYIDGFKTNVQWCKQQQSDPNAMCIQAAERGQRNKLVLFADRLRVSEYRFAMDRYNAVLVTTALSN